jgi:hypothetical protein
MAGSKGFRVVPEDLLAVADQVRKLHDDLSGSSGFVSGCLSEYQKADASVLRSSLTDFVAPGNNAYANAYDEEHKGIVNTMNAMVTQLASLEAACRNTAQQYTNQDKNSKHAVNSSDPGATSSAPTNLTSGTP